MPRSCLGRGALILLLDIGVVLLVVAVWRSLRPVLSSPLAVVLLAGAGAILFSLPIVFILRPRRPAVLEAVRQAGLPAEAVILHNRYYGNLQTYHGPEVAVELRVRVQPVDGAAFECQMQTPISRAGMLSPGARVQVKYTPDNPTVVVLD